MSLFLAKIQLSRKPVIGGLVVKIADHFAIGLKRDRLRKQSSSSISSGAVLFTVFIAAPPEIAPN